MGLSAREHRRQQEERRLGEVLAIVYRETEEDGYARLSWKNLRAACLNNKQIQKIRYLAVGLDYVEILPGHGGEQFAKSQWKLLPEGFEEMMRLAEEHTLHELGYPLKSEFWPALAAS